MNEQLKESIFDLIDQISDREGMIVCSGEWLKEQIQYLDDAFETGGGYR